MFETRLTASAWRRIPAFFATMLAALMLLAVVSGHASAGTYNVYSCSGPGGENLPNDAWLPHLSDANHDGLFALGPACSEYSVITASSVALAPGENAGLRFTAPAGTSISGYSLRRSAGITFTTSGAHPALSAGLRRTTSAGDTYWGECEARKTDCTISASGTQSANLTASRLQLGVECAETASSCGPGAFSVLRARLYESQVELKDVSAPALAVTGGSLPGASGLFGTYSLSVSGSDVGGGIRSLTLNVDGAPVSTSSSGGSCSEPYTKPVPCPLATSADFSLNIAPYSAGSHSVVVTATDAAGNVGTLAPITFTVSGVGANGTPAVEFPSLKTNKSVISTKTARKVAIRGVLRTTTGRAIGGATLDVNASSLGTASGETTRIGSTKTAANGSFSFKVKPNGALRITFVFRPAPGADGTATASTTLRQALSLSARRSQAKLRRGASFVIAGRLSGAGRAAAGAPVDIQVKNGKRWSTVATVVAGKSGNYKWKYRFKRVTRPTLFTFRANVRSKPGWPWPGRSSRPVQVLVLG